MADVKKKKIVIVFPPLTMPTSPPLGASMLKGFIERELPEWEVKVLDLNLWTFEYLFDALGSGRLHLNQNAFPEGPLGEVALVQAANVFRGKADAEFYNRPDRYDMYADLFLRLTESYTQDLAVQSEHCEKTGTITPMLQIFLDLILAEKPDCVGFSMIFSQQLPIGAALGKLLRTKYSQRVIFGGSCFADSAHHFFKFHPECADLIATGEGEETLKSFLNAPENPETIPGVAYLKDGECKKTESVFRKDMDYFGAPNFDGLELSKYFSPEPVIPVLLSRGCYWRRCTFCVHYRSAGLTYRMHSIEFVLKMLQDFVAKGIRNFAFIDEMISPKHFEWLARGIKEAKLDISYYALSKPTKHFTPEILANMKESGCKYLLWGLESGSQRILNLMDKGTIVEDVEQVLRHSHAAGIANHVFMICGFPTETIEEYAQTLQFLDRNKEFIYAVHRGTFSLEAESPIFDNPSKFGITRTWIKKETDSGGRWGYECESGMTSDQAKQVFNASLPFLRVFNPHARCLANFRDHALLVYDKMKHLFNPTRRPFPKLVYPSAPQQPVTVAGEQAAHYEHKESCT